MGLVDEIKGALAILKLLLTSNLFELSLGQGLLSGSNVVIKSVLLLVELLFTLVDLPHIVASFEGIFLRELSKSYT